VQPNVQQALLLSRFLAQHGQYRTLLRLLQFTGFVSHSDFQELLGMISCVD